MSAASGPRFAVGDAVISPRHGLGKVVGRSLGSVDERRCECPTVEVERRAITLTIPLESVTPSRLRPLASPPEARRALDALASAAEPLPARWPKRQHEAGARLGSGDLILLAELVRDLSHAGAARPGRRRSPAPRERARALRGRARSGARREPRS